MKTAAPSLASRTVSPPDSRSSRACRLVRLVVALATAAVVAGFVLAPVASAATGDFVITGRGYGHGQGMSQWGMWEGAREGNTYQQVLAFYYPGTTLTNISSVAPTRSTVTVRITTSYDTFASVQLTASVTGAILLDSTGATIQTLAAGDSVTLVYNGGRVQVSGVDTTYSYVDLKPTADTGRVTVKPSDGLWTNGARQYWGYIRVLPSSSAAEVYVHNIVPIDKYAAGVSEISPSWAVSSNTSYYAPDAVKAQTVAARTFVAVHSGAVPYDDSRDMNYVGYNVEATYPYLTTAAAETAGQVLTYGGKLVATHFSSSSGGYTSNSAWSDTSTLAYEPAQLDPWSLAAPPTNPAYAWTFTISPGTLASKLSGELDVGTITKMEVTERDTADATSHARKVKVTGSSGTATIAARTLESLLSLRSTLIISITKDDSLNRYEQNDTNLLYTGAWTVGSSTSASSGSYRYANTSGASCTVSFTGTYLAWYGKVKSTYGIARLTLDGVDQGTLDLYSSAEAYRKIWETGTLSDGAHTLTITCTGTKNPNSSNYNITVDAFDIDGTIAAPSAPPPSLTTTYQETDSHLLYLGAWVDQPATSASGGSFRYLDSAGSCTVKFTGTSVAWIGKKKSTYGIARITLDGVDKGTVDLYSASELYKQTLWQSAALSDDTHTLVITWNGTRNSKATNYNVSVDAFDIEGSIVQATPPPPSLTTTYQETDSHLLYLGAWVDQPATSASGGSFRYLDSAGSCTVKFTGTSVAWIGKKKSTYGIARITLDGVDKGTVDLYSASELYKQTLWQSAALSDDTHTLVITWNGTRNSKATNYNVSVDALQIVGTIEPVCTRYQQDDSSLTYAGSWAVFSTTGASSGSYKRANTSGASVTIKFNGTYLAWIATKGTTLGKALVSLDGGTAKSVSLAATKVAYQQNVWNTGLLAPGPHTVKIWWDASNKVGKYISVDAVDLIGAFE